MAADRFVVIENGYDEESFAGLGDGRDPLNPGCVTLLHSGIVYRDERGPRALFAALQHLQRAGAVSSDNLRLRFWAPLHDELLRSLATQYSVEPLIEICPTIGYRQALTEMRCADGLLVMQFANCNIRIPAKLYEYLRAGSLILALADPAGDTAGVLRRAGLDSVNAIVATLSRFLASVRSEGRRRCLSTTLYCGRRVTVAPNL